MTKKNHKSDLEWQQNLSPEQYRVLRKKGTDTPHSGKYNHFDDKGTYYCAGCGNALFSSETKYDSGSGWPSFFTPISPTSVTTESDKSLSEERTEVLCEQCGGHLGHVFNDGPNPTGLRYCMNSTSLNFKKTDKN